MTSLIKIFNKKNFIITVVTLYIFFWDMFHVMRVNFDIRLIIFLLSLFLLTEVIKDIKNKNFKFISICSIIFSLIIAHSFIVGNLLNTKFFISLIFLMYLFGIAYYFHGIILENKDNIIYLFITLFFVSIIIHLFLNYSSNPEPVSCGALKNILGGKNSFGTPIFFIHFLSSYSLIFTENSHLAMSGIAVIIYSIYLITSKDKNKLLSIFLILFLIVCFLKSSATLLAGTVISILTLIFFEFRRLNRYFIIFSTILISITTIVFFQDKVCVNKFSLSQEDYREIQKINPLTDNEEIKKIRKIENEILVVQEKININKEKIKKSETLDKEAEPEAEEISAELFNQMVILEKELTTLKSEQEKTLIKIDENFKKYDSVYQSSLSSEVFFHALKVTYNSVFLKPFGWGFQGYELAFNDYNKKNKVYRKNLEVYNSKDASNTFFKIITEFGFFSMFLYILILFILMSKKINIENKVFLIPFIITQSIRGAGYFNGAFALMLFLLIVIQFKKNKIKH